MLSEEELREMMMVKDGDHYNQRDIKKDVASIKSKYAERGKQFSQVDVNPRWIEGEGLVDLEYRINEVGISFQSIVPIEIGFPQPRITLPSLGQKSEKPLD